MKINIVIADDDKLMCQSLALLLNTFQFIDQMFLAYNGKEAIDLLEKHHINLAILDVRMPEMNGLLAAKHILKNFPEVKVINITMYDTDDTILDLIRVGVHGILLKGSTGIEELNIALTEVMNGTRYYSSEIQELLTKNSHHLSHRSRLKFTQRELEVLSFISEGKSSKEIGSVMNISVGTIENYRKELLRKTTTKNAAGLISFCIKNGVL